MNKNFNREKIFILIVPVTVISLLFSAVFGFYLGRRNSEPSNISAYIEAVHATSSPVTEASYSRPIFEPLEFFYLEYDKVAQIRLETIAPFYEVPELQSGFHFTLMEYTVSKGDEGFDEVFEMLNSFRYDSVETGQFWDGSSQNDYDVPFGIRIIAEPETGEPVCEYSYNYWALRLKENYYFPVEERFFSRVDDLVAEKGTILGPYKNAF